MSTEKSDSWSLQRSTASKAGRIICHWLLLSVSIVFTAQPLLAIPMKPDVCGDWSSHALPSLAAHPDLPILHASGVATDGETAWLLGFATDADETTREYLAASWDGQSWQEEPLPDIADMTLANIEIAGGHILMAGWTGDLYSTSRPLVIHRNLNGGEWQQRSFTGPQTEGDGALDFKAFSPIDYWMVGRGGRMMHWNGSQLDAEFLTGTIIALDGTSSSDLWAVGYSSNSSTAYHHDGFSWTYIPASGTHLPESFYSVVTLSSDDVWMFGISHGAGIDDINFPFALNWDGNEVGFSPSFAHGYFNAEPYGGNSVLIGGFSDYFYDPGYWDPVHQKWKPWRLSDEYNFLGSPLSAFGPCQIWTVSHGDGATTSDQMLLLTPTGIFYDDFEGGDLAAWSLAVGN